MPSYANASEGEVGPTGLEPGRALKNCPVGNFSEGARLPQRLEPGRKQKRQSKDCLSVGPAGLEPATPDYE
jgi:hypothetical protein